MAIIDFWLKGERTLLVNFPSLTISLSRNATNITEEEIKERMGKQGEKILKEKEKRNKVKMEKNNKNK
eukprot:7869412-Heterocapsa_arctica.AAC.1